MSSNFPKSIVAAGAVLALALPLTAGAQTAGMKMNTLLRAAEPRQEGVSDQQLFDQIAKKLVYITEGYGRTMFENFTLQVHGGVVDVGGTVIQPVDKDDALNMIKHTKGVQGVVDHIVVAPLSPNDDSIRRAAAQAIYGYPALNRYAMDPGKPIRIIVVNGHITLEGVVDSKADAEMAGMRANGVPGAFSVTNNLQVQGQGREH